MDIEIFLVCALVGLENISGKMSISSAPPPVRNNDGSLSIYLTACITAPMFLRSEGTMAEIGLILLSWPQISCMFITLKGNNSTRLSQELCLRRRLYTCGPRKHCVLLLLINCEARELICLIVSVYRSVHLFVAEYVKVLRNLA